MLQQVSHTLEAVTRRNSSRGFDGEVVTEKDVLLGMFGERYLRHYLKEVSM